VETVVLTALQSFRRHVAKRMDAAQQEATMRRACERIGVDRSTWSLMHGRNLDLAALRQLHEAISSGGVVRRADRQGKWATANARPGHLRSQPQSFRAATHIEPAWDHNTLVHRLAQELGARAAVLHADPLKTVADLVWTLVRAQPFVAENDLLAFSLASLLFEKVGLPTLHTSALVRDAAVTDALAETSSSSLLTFLQRRLWEEELLWVEWFGVHSDHRRSLADDHSSLTTARGLVVDDGEQRENLVAHAVLGVRRQSGAALESRRTLIDDHATRLRIAMASAGRGRYVCPHQALVETRVRLDDRTGADALIVAGAAGRGTTGASAIHLAVEFEDVAPTGGRAAPGLILLPDESFADQCDRLDEWIPFAMSIALRDSPLYGLSDGTRSVR